MILHSLLGEHVRELAPTLGFFVVPDRPPEGDPEYGLDRYIEFPERGLAILIDWNDVCSCIQLFSAKREPAYQQYTGPLPEGLAFNSSRIEVRGALGAPVESHDGGSKIFGIQVFPYDWFSYRNRKVHFEYGEAFDRVRMVSIMPLPTLT
jgi:hypothetical protein